jgi:hypothetical protein
MLAALQTHMQRSQGVIMRSTMEDHDRNGRLRPELREVCRCVAERLGLVFHVCCIRGDDRGTPYH